jgi:CheY-like chemotaxis protein
MFTRLPILLVEDDPDDAALTVRTLRQGGLENEVVIAADGIEALKYLFLPDADGVVPVPVLVILDVKLPGMGGVDVLRRLKNDPATRALPVVILTSHADERPELDAAALGVHAYVRKPLSVRELVSVLGRLGLGLALTGGGPVRPIAGGSATGVELCRQRSRARVARAHDAIVSSRRRLTQTNRILDRLAIDHAR